MSRAKSLVWEMPASRFKCNSSLFFMFSFTNPEAIVFSASSYLEYANETIQRRGASQLN